MGGGSEFPTTEWVLLPCNLLPEASTENANPLLAEPGTTYGAQGGEEEAEDEFTSLLANNSPLVIRGQRDNEPSQPPSHRSGSLCAEPACEPAVCNAEEAATLLVTGLDPDCTQALFDAIRLAVGSPANLRSDSERGYETKWQVAPDVLRYMFPRTKSVLEERAAGAFQSACLLLAPAQCLLPGDSRPIPPELFSDGFPFLSVDAATEAAVHGWRMFVPEASGKGFCSAIVALSMESTSSMLEQNDREGLKAARTMIQAAAAGSKVIIVAIVQGSAAKAEDVLRVQSFIQESVPAGCFPQIYSILLEGCEAGKGKKALPLERKTIVLSMLQAALFQTGRIFLLKGNDAETKKASDGKTASDDVIDAKLKTKLLSSLPLLILAIVIMALLVTFAIWVVSSTIQSLACLPAFYSHPRQGYAWRVKPQCWGRSNLFSFFFSW